MRFWIWLSLLGWVAFVVFALVGCSGCSLLHDTGEKMEAFRQLNRGL